MTQPTKTNSRPGFDWTAWYAKIPGIPADWGFSRSAEQATARREISAPRRRLHLAG